MGYFIDLYSWKLEDFKAYLKNADLIPSQRPVLSGIDHAFEVILAQGIKTVGQLFEEVKTKPRLQKFSKKSGVDEDYLKFLARFVKGFRTRINKLADFPETPEKVVSSLKKLGIENTLHLYERVLTDENRSELAQESGADTDAIVRLAKLADLSRIRWVNHTFAYVLYETGYDTVQKVARADHVEMHSHIVALNRSRQFYKGNIGVHDMKLCVDSARELAIELSVR